MFHDFDGYKLIINYGKSPCVVGKNVYKNCGRSPFSMFNGTSSTISTGPFSIAMLDYQRVNRLWSLLLVIGRYWNQHVRTKPSSPWTASLQLGYPTFSPQLGEKALESRVHRFHTFCVWSNRTAFATVCDCFGLNMCGYIWMLPRQQVLLWFIFYISILCKYFENACLQS